MAVPYSLETIKGQWNSTFFDTIGDGSGDICLGVDGSATPIDFRVTAPLGYIHYVNQFTGIVRYTGLFRPDTFDGAGVLPNGLKLYSSTIAGERLMTDQHPIRNIMDFGAYCFDTQVHRSLNRVAVLWRFKITDDGSAFRLLPGDSLIWRVADDLSPLDCMHIRAGMNTVPFQYK